jgi:putative membrane protein
MNSDSMRSVHVALVVLLVLVLLPALVMALFMSGMIGNGMMGGGMGGGGMGGGGMIGGNTWRGWLVMLLFWVLFVGGLVAVLIWAFRQITPAGDSERGAGSRPDDALEILKQRYARGNITAEQFEQIKRDLTTG